jgi:peptidoglycan/xylan/chitin deacetylase (PgdA/CDA1 family)
VNGPRRHRLLTRVKLAALALLGISAVSIPVTIALILSATGESDLLALGPARTEVPTATVVHARGTTRCRATRGYYALTFDDGPSPSTTSRLVAALRHAGATATFFDIGARARAHPELVNVQRTAGAIASHGYTHLRLTSVSPARRLQELQATARVLGYPNTFMRPPFGATDAQVDADLRRSGLTPVYWTVDTYDGIRSPAAVAAVAGTVSGGDVLRLHEGVSSTVAAVPALVRALRERGLCPGRLVASSETVLSPEGRPFHVIAGKP